jgi:adenosyl cobinamide kinase/adenosyl cobinamide phosphate guanylyltransferase
MRKFALEGSERSGKSERVPCAVGKNGKSWPYYSATENRQCFGKHMQLEIAATSNKRGQLFTFAVAPDNG